MIACARRETAEQTGLDAAIGRRLFVLDVGAPSPAGRTVELVFPAGVERATRPQSREPGRHAEFVPFPMARLLRLRPPIAGHLLALCAAYLGNLWRRDPGDTVADRR